MACGIILRERGDRQITFDPEHHDLYLWHDSHDGKHRIYRAGDGIAEDYYSSWKHQPGDCWYRLKSHHDHKRFKTIMSNIVDSQDVNYCLDYLIHAFLGKDTEYMRNLRYIQNGDENDGDLDAILDNADNLLSEYEGCAKDGVCGRDNFKSKLEQERKMIYNELFDRVLVD